MCGGCARHRIWGVRKLFFGRVREEGGRERRGVEIGDRHGKSEEGMSRGTAIVHGVGVYICIVRVHARRHADWRERKQKDFSIVWRSS